MSKTFLAGFSLLLANILICSAGRTHYYEGSGYPSYNSYEKPYGYYGNIGYGYGLNGYGGGYDGYQNYDDYNDEDYDIGNYGYGAYGGYQYGDPYGDKQYAYGGYQHPYGYQNQVLPSKLVGSPVVNEYVAPLPPISKSVTTSSLYQTHPSGYGNNGYAGGYGYGHKHGSAYGNGYYRK